MKRTLELVVEDRSYRAHHVYLTRTLRESEGAFGAMQGAAQTAFGKAAASGDKATQRIAARVQEMARDAKADIAGIREASKSGIIDDATAARQINAVQQRLTTFSRRAQAALASIGTDDARGLAGSLRTADAAMRTAAISNARYAAEARGAATATRQTGQAASESAPRVGVFGRAFGALTALLAGFSVATVARGLFSLNSGLEQTRIAFSVMLGDAKLADATLKSLFSFAETTPFMSQEVMEAARSLLAANVAAEDLEPTLRQIGDVASGVQMPLGELAAIYGKMRVDNRIMGDDLNQLGGRGVPVVAELAKVLGVAQDKIRGMAEKGEIGFAQLEQAFKNMTSEGGRFNGLMAKMSESTKGLVDSLVDVAGKFAQEITATAFDSLSGDIRTLRDRVNELREDGTMEDWGRQAAAAFGTAYEYGRIFLAFLVQWGPALLKAAAAVAVTRAAVLVLTTAFTVARTVMLTYQAGALLVSVAQALLAGNTARATTQMTLFSLAVRANPIGILVTVLVAAAAAVLAFKSATDRSAEATRSENEALREKLRLLRQMSGAQLYREQQQRSGRGASLVGRVQGIDARVAGLRGGTLSASRQVIRGGAFTGEGRSGNVMETQEQANQREINSLLAARVQWARQLARLGEEQAASDERMETSMEAQLGSQRARLAALLDIRAARRTPAQNAEITRLQALVARLEAEAAANDAPTTMPASSSDDSAKPKEKTAAQLAREAARAEDQREAAAFRTASARDTVADATRNGTTTERLAGLDTRAEMIRQERDAAEHLVALMEDGDKKRDAAATVRIRYARQEVALARERVDVEEEVAIAESEDRRDDDIRQAGREEDPAAKAALLEAAAAEHQARLTKIESDAEQARLELDGEAARTRMADEAATAEARVAALQDAYERAQTETEEYWQSDQRIRDEAAQVQTNLDAGLVASMRDIAEAKTALDTAYGIAETDEERARILAQIEALDGLGAAFDRVATRAARGVTGRLVDDLETAVDLSDDLERAFADMGATVLASISGSMGDVLDAARKLADVQKRRQSGDLTGTAGQLAALGAAAGVVGTVVGVVGGIVSAIREQRAAIEAARRATEQNTAAMLREDQIGADTSQPQIDAALAAADAWQEGLDAADGDAPQAFRVRRQAELDLRGLEDMGINVDDIRTMLQADDLEGAIEALRNRFTSLDQSAGQYAGTVGGVFGELEDAVRYLGLDGQAAMLEFFRLLRASGKDLGDLSALVGDAGAMTDEERTAAVAAVYEQIRAGSFDRGDLTSNELERILDQILQGSSTASGPTQAGSISSITATQGNLLLGYQQEQLRAQRAILAGVDAIVAGMGSVATARAGGDGEAYVTAGGQGDVTIPFYVTVDAGMTNEQIARAASEGLGKMLDEKRPAGRNGRAMRRGG